MTKSTRKAIQLWTSVQLVVAIFNAQVVRRYGYRNCIKLQAACRRDFVDDLYRKANR